MSNVLEGLRWLPKPFDLTTRKIDQHRLMEAYSHANKNSPDPSTKNGAILIDENGDILVYGVNKFPTGVAETESRLTDKAVKYRLVVHAEDSVILNAARHGLAVNGSTLYCPYYACSDCAKSIIQAGVKRVVGHAQLMVLALEHKTWVQSIVDAWETLHEAGVKCDLYDGVVGVTTRFNGQDISV